MYKIIIQPKILYISYEICHLTCALPAVQICTNPYFKTKTKMETIIIANQKGGVGKTTLSFNLVHAFSAMKGFRILAIDNDPQGNLTSSFLKKRNSLTGNILNIYDDKNVQPERIDKNLEFLGADTNLAPVAERSYQVIFKLKEYLETKQHEFDYCFIDCLPSFGYLHLAALTAADYVLIPIKPAPYAFEGLKEFFNTLETVKKYHNPSLSVLGIAINQFDGRNPIMEREMEEALREIYGNKVLKTKINKRIKIEESPAFQKSIFSYDPKGKSTQEFSALTNEIMKRLKNGR